MDSDVATKKDLQEVETRLTGKMQEMEDRLTERIRDMQTEMLRAFYDWQQPVTKRLGHVDELAQRLSWVEERLAALERKQLGGKQ